MTLSREIGVGDVNNTVLYRSGFGNIFYSAHYKTLELCSNYYAACQASGN